MIRPPQPEETPTLAALAVSTGLFQPAEADLLLRDVLDDLHAGRLGEGHHVRVWCDDSATNPSGWVYYAAEPKAPGIWNLWWIGIAPTRHREGIGRELLEFVERAVRESGGRLLLVETSDSPELAGTRCFYERLGYRECGRIPDYYAIDEAKVIFAKRPGS